MASTDARPVPIKNTAYRVVFPIFDADGDLVTGATGLDSEVSKDQGAFADCTNEATEIATSSGMYYLDLTSTEMNADCVAVIVKTATSGAKTTPLVMYPQETGDIKVDTQSYGGTAGTFASGRPEVNTTHVGGTSQTGRDLGASVLLSSGTGAGQLDFTSGVVKANVTQFGGSAGTFSGGVPSVDAIKLGGSTTAGTRMGQFMAAVRRITVDNATFTPTTTAVETSATVDEESAYLNQAIFFEATGITRIVTTYAFTNSKVKLTFAALPSAPSNGAAIQILGKFGNS